MQTSRGEFEAAHEFVARVKRRLGWGQFLDPMPEGLPDEDRDP